MEDNRTEATDQAVIDDAQSLDAPETPNESALETPRASAAEDTGSVPGQADAQTTEAALDFEKYVGGKPRHDDPDWVSMQGDYTRKTQAIAQERKLGVKLRELGIEPDTFLAQIDVLQANPHLVQPAAAPNGPVQNGPVPAAFPTPFAGQPGTAAADPVASDPEVAEAQEVYHALAEAYGEQSGEARSAALQLRTLTAWKQREAAAAQQAQAQQWHQAQATRESDFSRLAADALAQPLLQNPAIQRDVATFAAQTGIPVETALFGRHGREAIGRAEASGYKRGFEEGRNARAKAKGDSMQPGRSAQTVEQTVELRYEKGRGMRGLLEQAHKAGFRLPTAPSDT